MDFDDEDYYGADSGDRVGDDDGDVAKKDSLDYEEHRAQTKHKECRHGNTIRISRTDSGYRLRQIAKNHAEGCSIACYIYNGIHNNLISQKCN